MIPVGSNLYLGDISSLAELPSRSDVTAALSLLTPPHSSYPSLQNLPPNHQHLAIALSDTSTASLLAILPTALSFIHKHVRASNGVLIHCLHGRSRSAATALAYLLSISSRKTASPEGHVKATLQQLRKSYPLAAPSDSFIRQLVAFAERLPISPNNYAFPGDLAWRSSAGFLERAEVFYCLMHAWPQECASDSLPWESLLLPNPSREDAAARCRKCRMPLLSAASLGTADNAAIRKFTTVLVMPVQWIGGCIKPHEGTVTGRLRCPGCQAKVGIFDKTWTGGLPKFAITTSAVDFIALSM